MGSDERDAASSSERALFGFLPDAPVAARGAHHVTALLVAPGESPELPRCLAAFAAQTRPADDVSGFDPDDLPQADPSRARGTLAACLALAVAHRVSPQTVPPQRVIRQRASRRRVTGRAWYWILHDDVAAEPGCLAALLAAADRNPEAAVLIPKAVGWSDRSRLVGVGNGWATGALLVEPLDSGERDQGQHDQERAVYAGDSAGMLVRADVWESLDGMDPLIGDWAAPADLCRRSWGSGHSVVFVPDAVVAHRRAHRIISADRLSTTPRHLPSARRVAREGQILLGLTAVRGVAVLGRALYLALATTLRCLGLLVTREPEDAAGELAGAWDAISGRKRLRAVRTRAWRAPVTSLRPPRRVRAPRGTVAGHALESWLVTTGLATWSWRRMRVSRSARTALTVTAALALASILRDPGVLIGPGSLHGGGLLPAPGAMTLVRAYLDSWHDVRLGTSATVPSYPVGLAALAVPLLGSVDVLLRLLLVLAVPLAFLSARWALGALDVRARTWAALAYATLPAAVAAVGGGRLGTVVVIVWGPVCVRLVLRLVSPRLALPGPRVRASIAAGCALGILALFSPAALLLLPGAALLAWRRPEHRAPLAWMCAVMLTFALMWLPIVARNPAAVFAEIGRDDPVLLRPGALPAALSPGGPGAPGWVGAVLLGAALLAVVGRPGGHPGAASWRASVVVLASLAALAGLAWLPWQAWLGIPLALVGVALILVIAGQARRGDPRATSLLRVSAAALLLGWWFAPSGALETGDGSALPSLAASAGVEETRARTLVLARQPDGVHYAVSNGAGPRLGDADVLAAATPDDALRSLVGQLVGGSAGDPVPGLVGRGIGYVVATTGPDDPLVSQVDAVPGLRRLATDAQQSLWRVADDPTRAHLAGGTEPPLTVPVRTSPTTVDVELHPGISVPRVLRLAESPDEGWVAELAGQQLDLDSDEFGMIEAPLDSSGWLLVRHRTAWPYVAGAHLAALAVLLLIALPKPPPRDLEGEAT